MNIIKERFSDKSGIAFIITIGLLGLLMITAVTFVVFMKTEREATNNASLIKRTRQLALSGVADAMAEIDHSLEIDNSVEYYLYPSTNNGWYISLPPLEKDRITSSIKEIGDVKSDTSSDPYKIYKNLRSDIYYNKPGFVDLLPRETFDNAFKFCQIDAYKIVNDKYKVFDEIFDYSGDKDNKPKEYRGNFSYIIVNLSGTLDANFIGDELPLSERGLGGYPTNFYVEALPGIDNETKFIQYRDSMPEYFETTKEILDGDKANDGIISKDVKCIYPFSFFYSDSDSSKQVVGNTEAQLIADMAKLNKIAAALKNDANVEGSVDAAYANPNVKFATLLNLLDYLDDDNKPGGLAIFEDPPNANALIKGYNTPCAEPFPMINEVYLNTKFITISANGVTPYSYTMLTTLNIELWYPFVSPTCKKAFPDGFDLEYTIHFGTNQLETTTTGSPVLNLLPDKSIGTTDTATQNTGKPREWTETIFFESSDFDDKVIAGKEAIVYLDPTRKFNFLPRSTDLTNITDHVNLNNKMIVSVDIKIKEKGTAYDDDSNTFDGFDPAENDGVNYMLQFEVPLAIDGTKQLIDTDFDKQVIDPRLNYKATNNGVDWWRDMEAPNNTDANIGKINIVTTDAWAENSTDDDGKMFIKGYKGHPATLESIGEFGYIFTGRPWETVRLLDRDGNVSRHLIYENLILASDTNRTSGFANVNTEFDEVLDAVINNIPLAPDDYNPDGFTHITNPDDVVAAIKKSIKTFNPNNTGISSTNLFDAVFQTNIINALGAKTEFEKEAFYISGYPAFNSRQQLFAIISKGYINNSAQYCMAIVWRDPVATDEWTDGNGDKRSYHKCFVREVTWLDNQY